MAAAQRPFSWTIRSDDDDDACGAMVSVQLLPVASHSAARAGAPTGSAAEEATASQRPPHAREQSSSGGSPRLVVPAVASRAEAAREDARVTMMRRFCGVE